MASFDTLIVGSLTIKGAFAADDVTIGGLADLASAAGAPDAVYTQAAVVAAPSALTSAAITGGESPTEAEHNAVRADVAALHTTVAALLVALKGAGKPMAAA